MDETNMETDPGSHGHDVAHFYKHRITLGLFKSPYVPALSWYV